jgi:hypothetical protein
VLLWCCLLNWLLLLHDRNLTTHQDAGDAVEKKKELAIKPVSRENKVNSRKDI